MCGPTRTKDTPAPTPQASGSSSLRNRTTVDVDVDVVSAGRAGLFDVVFPLPPSIAVLAMAAILPSWFYRNRGFTVWFHLLSVLQVVTQSRFLVGVLALSGISICLGWYSCLAYEYVHHGRWCHALYKNMPSALTQQMVQQLDDDGDDASLDFESAGSLAAMAICHFLDFLGHPLLAYYYWSRCQNQKNEDDSNQQSTSNQTTIDKNSDDDGIISTWPVILSAYSFSRMWSFFHTYHNFGSIAWFYVGFDVYVMDDLDSWYPAYIIETLFYGALVVWKLTRKTIPSESKPGQRQ